MERKTSLKCEKEDERDIELSDGKLVIQLISCLVLYLYALSLVPFGTEHFKFLDIEEFILRYSAQISTSWLCNCHGIINKKKFNVKGLKTDQLWVTQTN